LKAVYFLRYLLEKDHWDWQKNGLIKHVDAEGYFNSNIGDSEIVPGVTKWRVSFE